VTWTDAAGVGLLAVAGFLVGGVYATWRTARAMAVALIVCAVLAAAAAIAWLL
jgi:hypothetical protein